MALVIRAMYDTGTVRMDTPRWEAGSACAVGAVNVVGPSLKEGMGATLGVLVLCPVGCA